MNKNNQHIHWKLEFNRRWWLPLVFMVVVIGCSTRKAASGPRAAETPTPAPVAPATSAAIHHEPANDEEMLDESEKLAARLEAPDPINRADYLVELCKVSVTVKSPKAAARCRAAFDFARTNVTGCESERLQAQAVASLSAVDAQRAMNLLGKIPNSCGGR